MPDKQTQEILKLLDHSKNIILQGAPGTGKTWTIPEVVTRLCGTIKNDGEVKRSEVIKAYKELMKDGRVVFTTFHPSYDYEDFVEGWIPGNDTNNEGAALNPLRVRPGIFRQICENAYQYEVDEEEEKVDEEVEKLPDDDFGVSDQANIWGVWLDMYSNPLRDECLANNHIRISYSEYPKDTFSPSIPADENVPTDLKHFYNNMKPGDIVVTCFGMKTTNAIGRVTDSQVVWDGKVKIKDYEDYNRTRAVEWLWKGDAIDFTEFNGSYLFSPNHNVFAIRHSSPEQVRKFLRRRKAEQNIQAREDHDHKRIPYVLVIDEINRGNIAKIFGELITLLEADKRKGGLTETSVTLPFSQEEFTVPDNLYIIGTMNTADRSIGAIDYALRRRFSFFQMEPQKLADDDFNKSLFDQVKAIFQKDGKPNRTFLSEEFDPLDVMPGQSYFIATDEEKEYRFKYELKPLLEEYLRDGVLLPAARAAIDDLKV